MASSSYGLGRGLDSLIARKQGTASLAAIPSASTLGTPPQAEVPIDSIDANDHQPRKDFQEEQLEELTQSIRQYGIIQPLVVSKVGARYRLIAGERRLRAAKRAGLTKVPVCFREAREHERLEIALIENIQRVDLNPIELAIAYQQLKDEFSLTQEQIAIRVNRARPSVTNTLRLLSLPEEIQSGLIDGRINFTSARAILAISNKEDQLKFFHSLTSKQVSSSTAFRLAKEIAGKPSTKRYYSANPKIVQKEELLREHLGTKVRIERKDGHGQICIEYYSEEELNALVDKIIRE